MLNYCCHMPHHITTMQVVQSTEAIERLWVQRRVMKHAKV